MFKKIALIVLFVGATFGMAFMLYRFFFAGAPAPTGPGAGGEVTEPGGGLPTAGEGRPTAPGETPTGLPTAPGVPTAPGQPTAAGELPPGTSALLGTPGTVATEIQAGANGLNYYNATDGRFYGIDDDGNALRLSERSFAGVDDVVWAPNGDKAVITFPDASKIVYDFDAETQVTLPRHWEDFGFSADGETIVAKSIGLDPANRWLVAAAADGSGTRLIEPLGENADQVVVSVSPDSAIVAFSDTAEPVGFDSRDLLPIGTNGENLKSLRVEGFDFTPLWSPDGDRLLYSAAAGADGYLPSLWAVGADGSSVGGGRIKLNVYTWADKCTFASGSVIYCAEPQGLPQGAGLQRDVADGLNDRLLRIDLSSGTVRNVTPAGYADSAVSMTLSGDGSKLFVANTSGQITRVDLF